MGRIIDTLGVTISLPTLWLQKSIGKTCSYPADLAQNLAPEVGVPSRHIENHSAGSTIRRGTVCPPPSDVIREPSLTDTIYSYTYQSTILGPPDGRFSLQTHTPPQTPSPLSCNGAHDVSQNGLGGLLLGPNDIPHLWCSKVSPYIAHCVISWGKYHGCCNMSVTINNGRASIIICLKQ